MQALEYDMQASLATSWSLVHSGLTNLCSWLRIQGHGTGEQASCLLTSLWAQASAPQVAASETILDNTKASELNPCKNLTWRS